MRMMLRLLMLVMITAAPAVTFAQQAGQQDWLVETMYRSGKINSVVAVVAVVLAGLAVWMFRMDRRIKRMEATRNDR